MYQISLKFGLGVSEIRAKRTTLESFIQVIIYYAELLQIIRHRAEGHGKFSTTGSDLFLSPFTD